jgi:hypothetical protein
MQTILTLPKRLSYATYSMTTKSPANSTSVSHYSTFFAGQVLKFTLIEDYLNLCCVAVKSNTNVARPEFDNKICCSVENAVRNRVLCIVLSCSSAGADLQEGQQQGLFT